MRAVDIDSPPSPLELAARALRGARALAACAALVGCSQGASATTTGASATASALPAPLIPYADIVPHDAIPEFPSLDPSVWVNGAPVTLASLHNDVVLVEAWHRF